MTASSQPASLEGTKLRYFPLAPLQQEGVERLPMTIKILLEGLLRERARGRATDEQISALAHWPQKPARDTEIPFQPARILMQDFTGVPAIVDLAAMRDAMEGLGGAPARINPLVPVDLVIDHSVQVDAFGNPRAFDINADPDDEGNEERYAVL